MPHKTGGGMNKKAVVVIKDGKLVGRYDSVTLAGEKLNITPSQISAVCLKKKRYKTARGYNAVSYTHLLDDYLMNFAVKNNYKLATNTLKRFGQIAEDFKSFVNQLRSNGSDIIFICHDKEVAEGDIIKHSPDCTGQSKDLLLRIADQVGYISKVNGKRTISFEPTDTFIGKNVAQLKMMEIRCV